MGNLVFNVVLHLTPLVMRELTVTRATGSIQAFILDELGVPILAEGGGFILAEAQPYEMVEQPIGLVWLHLTPELQQTVDV